MSWTIERRGRVAVVTMTTNPVNAQNQVFFADLHDAFDRLERAAALRDIAGLADPLDTELPSWMTSQHARHAHRRYWQQLKGRPADW
jgi:predicted xylose isomerase-like sugar epimerase